MYDKFRLNEIHLSQYGVPEQSHQYTVYPLWRQHMCVFSHAKGPRGAEFHPGIDCPKHIAPFVATWHGSGRLWRTSNFLFIVSHTFSTGDLVFLLARALVHYEEHVTSQQSYVNERCPAEKVHHNARRRNGSSTGLTTRSM